MTKLDNNSIIRRKLKSKHGVKFTCGVKDYRGNESVFKMNVSEYSYSDRTEFSYSVNEDRPFGQGMNVNKFGPTCLTLYTFDMLGRKTVGKIKYSDIKLVG